MEEACAEVVDHELLGYQHFVSLDEDSQSEGRLDAIYWARARVLAFEPRYETTKRRLLTPEEARGLPFWANPVTSRFLNYGFDAEARHV